jgi:hypothetical protein
MPGVDYFNSVANVALLDRNFSWWMNGFKDAVYTGYPLALDFPQFQYYGMLVLTKFLGVAHGVQYYVVFTLGLLRQLRLIFLSHSRLLIRLQSVELSRKDKLTARSHV